MTKKDESKSSQYYAMIEMVHDTGETEVDEEMK